MDVYTVNSGNKARVGAMERPASHSSNRQPAVFLESHDEVRIEMTPAAARRIARKLNAFARAVSE